MTDAMLFNILSTGHNISEAIHSYFIQAKTEFLHAACIETNLEVSHSPIADVDRVLRISLNCTRVTSNCTIKVSSLECFICLRFEALCLRWVPCAFAVT